MRLETLLPRPLDPSGGSECATLMGSLFAAIHLDRRRARALGWRGVRPSGLLRPAWTCRVAGSDLVFGLVFTGEARQGDALCGDFAAYAFPRPEDALLERFPLEALRLAGAEGYGDAVRALSAHADDLAPFHLGTLSLAASLDGSGLSLRLRAPARRRMISLDGVGLDGPAGVDWVVRPGEAECDVPAFRLLLRLFAALVATAEALLGEEAALELGVWPAPLYGFDAGGRIRLLPGRGGHDLHLAAAWGSRSPSERSCAAPLPGSRTDAPDAAPPSLRAGHTTLQGDAAPNRAPNAARDVVPDMSEGRFFPPDGNPGPEREEARFLHEGGLRHRQAGTSPEARPSVPHGGEAPEVSCLAGRGASSIPHSGQVRGRSRLDGCGAASQDVPVPPDGGPARPEPETRRPLARLPLRHRPRPEESGLPVLHVLTGFLGAGKTTFLRRWLDFLHGRERYTGVIQNEFGEIGLDAALMRGDTQVEALDEGCVCCSLADSLRPGLLRLVESMPAEQFILETTGLANPANVMASLAELSDIVRPGLVITVVDALDLMRAGDAGLRGVRRAQAERADVLVVNKADAVEPAALEALMERLRALNGQALLLPARHGSIAFAELDAFHSAWLDRRGTPPSHRPTLPRLGEAVTHAEEGYASAALRLSGPLSEADVRALIEKAGPGLARAKGVIDLVTGEGIVPAVAQYAAGRLAFEPAPEDEKRYLVFIGTDLTLPETTPGDPASGRMERRHAPGFETASGDPASVPAP